MVNRKNLFQIFFYFFFFDPILHQVCFVSNVLENLVNLTTLNTLRTTRVTLMIFCFVNTPGYQILVWVCKILCPFQHIFTCEKIKVDIIKRQKISALKTAFFLRHF